MNNFNIEIFELVEKAVNRRKMMIINGINSIRITIMLNKY